MLDISLPDHGLGVPHLVSHVPDGQPHPPHGRLVHLNFKELLCQQSCAINDKEPACVSKESHQLKCKICTPNGGIWVAPLSFSMKVVYYSDTILKPFKTLITL